MKTIALLTFIAVYALLLLLPKYRAVSALSAAALFLLLRIVPLGDVAGTVDWNVLMMLAGTMGTVDLFIRSNMPNRLSDRLVAVLPSVKWLIIALALFAGLVSAFVDNVAAVLMLAYNGTRGSGHKQLFYWFYPAHVYLLYGVSCLVYRLIA